MIINFSSEIIKNLIIPGFDDYFTKKFKNPRIDVSSLKQDDSVFNIKSEQHIGIFIKSQYETFVISLITEGLSFSEHEDLFLHLEALTYESGVVLSLIIKRKFQVTISRGSAEDPSYNDSGDIRVISISITSEKTYIYSYLLIPAGFLRLFSKKLTHGSDIESIETAAADFFKNPLNLFPKLSIIFETFSDIGLQNLLYQLQKKNLLSVYQICLLALSFPQFAIRIKKNLPANTADDVMELMGRMKSSRSINNRDLAEGVYSVEESIYLLMKTGGIFSFSTFLAGIQNTIRTLSCIEVLLSRGFHSWIDQCEKNGLLYNVISGAEEIVIAGAISENPGLYLEIFKRHVSDRKIKSMADLAVNKSFSHSEMLFSQSLIVSNYRKCRLAKLNTGDENFDFIIRRISYPIDLNYLLFDVGWFTLSTALKGTKRAVTLNIIKELPLPARYLIDDAVGGIINPNIIHDELQISKARSHCVKSILSLYECGLIRLAD